MAKRASKADGFLIVVVLVVAAIGAAVKWMTENLAIVLAFLAIVAVLYGLVVASSRAKAKERAAWLLQKYGDQEVVDRILDKTIWQGQTEDQLSESLGSPHAIDKQLLKTKRKEIWKYDEVKKGQYRLRVTVENGHVIGWDKKS